MYVQQELGVGWLWLLVQRRPPDQRPLPWSGPVSLHRATVTEIPRWGDAAGLLLPPGHHVTWRSHWSSFTQPLLEPPGTEGEREAGWCHPSSDRFCVARGGFQDLLPESSS